jgi:hypothetical protein
VTFTVGPNAVPGSYPIVITGTSGTIVNTATVTLTVNAAQVLTKIIVTPSTASVSNSQTITFSASAYDQSNVLMTSQPVFIWSVSGGGTISNGVFTSTSIGGPFTVTAKSGTVSGTASVTVNAGPLITSATITPTTILSSGGNVTIAASVADPSYTISSVTSELLQNGVAYEPITLSTTGGGAFNKTLTLPANTAATPDVYTATVTAIDSAGISTTVNAAGKVTQSSNPTTTLVGGPADGSTICANSAVFTVTGTDAVTPTNGLYYEYSLDSGAYTTAAASTTITLTNLSDGTHTLTVKAVNGAGDIDPNGATVTFTVSSRAPVISAIQVTPADLSAVVTWTTDKPTTSQVVFGTTSSYGQSSLLYSTAETSHSVVISGLKANTAYHYQVVSANSCQQAVSADGTFTTLITQLPNLEVTQLTGPTSVVQGQTVQVAWTVSNVGLGTAVAPWNDDLYLSTTPNYSSGAVLLGKYTNQISLLAGQNYTATQQVTLPSKVYGTYYLILYTNGDKTLAESNSTDNANAIAINISKQQQLIVTPSTLTASLNIGVPQTGNLTLTSNSSITLTGIKATVTGLSSNINATVTVPLTLAPGQSEGATVTVTAVDKSVLSSTPVIHFTDDQGDSIPVDVTLTVINPLPQLSVQPGSINTGMLVGTQTVYGVTITNTGAATAKALTVSLPPTAQVPWLALASPATIGDLAPGASASVNLALSPAATLPLGQYTGNLAINGANTSASVNYSIDAVTTAKGTVNVVSSDEFTFLSDTHPPLTGADVTVTDPLTGAVVLSAVTDDTGNFTSSIIAGSYNIEVTSPGHTSYNSALVIQPGQTTPINAFLSRNLVTYTWTVIPIITTDTYDITLTATFQTHVPAPEVTISPALLNLSTLTFDSNGQAVVDYTLTNNGLIAAQNVKFTFPNQPTYYMVPAISNLGSLAAESSVVIPVTIYAVNPNTAAPAIASVRANVGVMHANDDPGGSCPAGGDATYTFECGGNNDQQSVEADVDGGPACGDEGTPPPDDILDGGGGGGGGGDGGGEGGVTAGGSGSPSQVVQMTSNCDECLNNELIAIAECLVGFIPGVPCIINGAINGAECGYSLGTASGSAQLSAAGLGCLAGLGGTVLSCAGSVNPIFNIISCAIGLSTACLPGPPPPGPGPASGAVRKVAASKANGVVAGGGGAQTDNQVLNGLLDQVTAEANLAQTQIQPLIDFYGSTKWFSSSLSDVATETALETAFLADAFPSPGVQQSITPAQAATLEGLKLPAQLSVSDVGLLVARWNNTYANYNKGIFTTAQLPAGGDHNFIDLGQVTTDEQAAQAAVQKDAANGYVGLTTGIQDTEQNIQAYIQSPEQNSSGVCATVKIQLDQTVELTRTTFQATLDLTNAPQNVPLSGINVSLKITDAAGHDATSLFVISAPALSVFNGGVDGTGTLVPGATGTAQWSITPTRQAALTTTTVYYVSGILTYSQNGTQIQIPLFPTGITVVPDPYLQFHYFLNQQVYSQDPLDLPTIDPVEPFYLGVLVQNAGGGIAQNLSITSSQPQIVDNQKGLAINFDIIGTQVNLQPVSPSLTVDLGNIAADGGTAAATFDMTSSLSGQFIGFNATFHNTNPLGNTQTSLIDSVDTHTLNHIVQIDPAATEPDFLTEETPIDQSMNLPDTVWQGTSGQTAAVTAITDAAGGIITYGTASVDHEVSNSDTTVHLTVTPPPGGSLPTGYVFIRVNDPGNGQFALESVTRSDGKVIPVGTDAWTTKRMQHPNGAAAYIETRFYIFDDNTTGSYTLTYYPVAPVLSSISPTTVSAGGPSFTLYARGTGFVSGDQIVVNGAPLSTQFDSGSQLEATIPAADVAAAASLNISVTNPSNGTAVSGADILAVTPPVGKPVVAVVSPSTGSSFTAPATTTLIASASEQGGTISEVDFYANNVWVGKATSLPFETTFSTPSVGTYQITAVATDANGVTASSSAVTIQVIASTSGVSVPPVITGLSPSSTLAGGGTFTLIVTGTGFNSNSIINWDGQALPTSYVSSAQLTAQVSSTFIGQPGSPPITVTNPSLSSGTSAALSFTITAPAAPPAPVITNLAPATVLAGTGNFTLIVDGTGFDSSDVVDWSGLALPTTFISATQLSAAVAASKVAKAGAVPIIVVDTSTTNSQSAPANLTITSPPVIAPTITLTAPIATTAYTSPANVTITANPVTFGGATVTKVVFTSNSNAIQTVTSAPYTFVYSGVTTGTYVISATVTDSNGTTVTSAPVTVTVTVPPTVSTLINVTSSVSVTLGALSKVGHTATYIQSVIVKNTTTSPIVGPITLVLDKLTKGVVLSNSAGSTTTAVLGTVGSPYLTNSGTLAPSGTTTFTLTFSDPTLAAVTYQSRVLAGAGTP